MKYKAEVHTAVSYSNDGKSMMLEIRDDVSGTVLFKSRFTPNDWIEFTSGGIVHVEAERGNTLERVGKKMIVNQFPAPSRNSKPEDPEVDEAVAELIKDGWVTVERRKQNTGLVLVARRWVDYVPEEHDEDYV